MGAVTGLPSDIGNAVGGATGGLGGGIGLPNWKGGGGPFSPLLGTAGGAGGTGFATPQQANIQSPVTQGQIDTAQGGANNSLASQQALIKALGGNTGNLNAVYGHGNDAYTALAGLNGIGTMGTATGQQGGLNQGLSGLGGVGTMGGATAGTHALNQGLGGVNGVGMMGSAGAQQNALNSSLGGLNGAGAAGSAMAGSGALAGQLGGAGGIGAQTSAIGGLQNVLAQQQAVANGTGPNPAQAMLNQATGQNVANQAALMAGQRGAGSNVGLMARQAAQQGAGIQQNAAGQSASMQAQQQMNALNSMGQTNQALAGVGAGLTGQQAAALGQLYGQGTGTLGLQQGAIGQQFGQGMQTVGAQQAGLGQEFGQGAQTTGMQQTGIGQLYGQGAGTTGMQQGQIGMNAGIAQNQIGNEMGATNQGVQNNIGNAGQVMGAGTAYNQGVVSSQGNVNTGNTTLANTGMQGQQGFVGGIMNGGAAAFAADGGEVRRYADGTPDAPVGGALPAPGAQSSFGKFLSGYGASTPTDMAASSNPGAQQLQKGSAALAKALAGKMKGGGTGTDETPGGYAGGDMSGMGAAAMVAKGGPIGTVHARGPDQKATKPGNDYANDKVPAMLSEGEVVLPRSVMGAPDPVAAASRFVAALQAKKGRK